MPYFVDNVLHYNSIMATGSAKEIKEHVHQAIAQVNGKGLILGPGCVTDPKTTEENYYAVRQADETYKLK